MKIKFPGELETGDIVIIDKDRYIVEKYEQGNCMGSFIWGWQGRLDCFPFTTSKLEELQRGGGYPVNNKSRKQLMTYENYPYIVLEKSDIKSY